MPILSTTRAACWLVVTSISIWSLTSALTRCKDTSAREDVIASVSPASGMVQSGQRIIDRGEIISAEQYNILQSFENELVRRNDHSEGIWIVITGQTIFVACIIISVMIYLKLFRRDYLYSPHTLWLLVSLIALFPLVTYFLVDHKFYNVYMVPYAIIPIFVRIFMDSRTAFMAMVCSVILSSFALHANYEFIIVEMMGGMTAICALKDLTERSQLVRVAFFVFFSHGRCHDGIRSGTRHRLSNTWTAVPISIWLSTAYFCSSPTRSCT